MYIALSTDLTIANSLMFSNERLLGIFFPLANNLYSFPEILVRMEQLKFIETDCMPING